jgi:alkylated DNA repair dioxygenase AlkB
MPQLTLFDSDETLLADDERGRIAYAPRFVDAPTAHAWFTELRRDVNWQSARRMMYDREVEVPRLIGHFRLDEPAAATPGAILEAARLVSDRLGVAFNSVGLNLYRDGRDSVAPHHDHLYEIRKGFPIALVSLGATRRMTIRAKEPPRDVVHIDLEAGSLLVMDYTTQLHYTHGVPKTPAEVGERISLAFRVKRRREGSAQRY